MERSFPPTHRVWPIPGMDNMVSDAVDTAGGPRAGLFQRRCAGNDAAGDPTPGLATHPRRRLVLGCLTQQTVVMRPKPHTMTTLCTIPALLKLLQERCPSQPVQDAPGTEMRADVCPRNESTASRQVDVVYVYSSLSSVHESSPTSHAANHASCPR